MTTEDKVLAMFNAVHGELGNCTAALSYDDNDEVLGVDVTKAGQLCWHESKVDILFNFITKEWE